MQLRSASSGTSSGPSTTTSWPSSSRPRMPSSRGTSAPSSRPATPGRSRGGCALRRCRVGLPQADRVPFCVRPGSEPAHGRDGLWIVGLAAQLFHSCGAGVDVVDLEVDADCARVSRKHSSARVLAEPDHVVLHRAFHRLELPAEQVAVELLGSARVACRNLEMDGLSSHEVLLPDAGSRPTISVHLRSLGYVVVVARRRGRVARYFAFARAKKSGSRSCSPISQSTNASLY